MKTPNQLYKYHVENLRSIDSALTRISLSYRHAIAANNDADASVFKRLYALLLGAWAECKLLKTLFQPNAFSDEERATIGAAGTHLERWQKLVEIAFRKHCGVPNATLSESTLGHDNYKRFDSIRRILEDDLCSIIMLRNKLAHGQWKYPLNSDGDDVAQSQMEALRLENILTLQFKRIIIASILEAVFDLAVSQPTFERDFNLHYRKIACARSHLKNRDYKKYESMMREKYKRGRAKLRKS